jgi:hypothetical protein
VGPGGQSGATLNPARPACTLTPALRIGHSRTRPPKPMPAIRSLLKRAREPALDTKRLRSRRISNRFVAHVIYNVPVTSSCRSKLRPRGTADHVLWRRRANVPVARARRLRRANRRVALSLGPNVCSGPKCRPGHHCRVGRVSGFPRARPDVLSGSGAPKRTLQRRTE